MVDISIYLSKRKAVMLWLQRYGHNLNLSKNCVAAAQHYADMYYHNYTYEQKEVKLVLTSLLILGSKYWDYKILYTNHIAKFC